MPIESYIEQQLETTFLTEEFADLFLIEVKVEGRKIEVFLDGDQGITLGRCQKISRLLESDLETQELVEENYVIEVSSPGTDRPLISKRQYPQHIGRTLNVVMAEESLKGMLTATDTDHIVISVKVQKRESEKKTIAFSDIIESTVEISFN